MTDSEYIAMWVRHCGPVAIFCHVKVSGIQYLLMPLMHDDCEVCGLVQ